MPQADLVENQAMELRRPDTSASRVHWASTANMTRAPHHTESHLARHPEAGRMNVTELLAVLQAQHDEATARAGELHGQIEHLYRRPGRDRGPTRGPGHRPEGHSEAAPGRKPNPTRPKPAPPTRPS
ncbi:hypothetical protein [Streptomyces thioluteus]|uniref:hypothetical protein n=1 Tax=Streptomyces thioluteus TaxID=66431 RepID=UPI0031ECC767